MSQDRSETLVIELYGNLRHCLTPTVDKLLHTLQILTGLSVRLAGFAYYNTLHLLTSDICLQIIKQLRRGDSRQSPSYNLKRIGDCQSCTFLTVIDR